MSTDSKKNYDGIFFSIHICFALSQTSSCFATCSTVQMLVGHQINLHATYTELGYNLLHVFSSAAPVTFCSLDQNTWCNTVCSIKIRWQIVFSPNLIRQRSTKNKFHFYRKQPEGIVAGGGGVYMEKLHNTIFQSALQHLLETVKQHWWLITVSVSEVYGSLKICR